MTRKPIPVHHATAAQKLGSGKNHRPANDDTAPSFSAMAAKEFNDAIAAADALYGECRNAVYRNVVGSDAAELKRRNPSARSAVAALSPEERAAVDIALFYCARAINVQRLRGSGQCTMAIKLVAGRIHSAILEVASIGAAPAKPANDLDPGSSAA
ncbi:MAG: hypothetical protein KKF88_12340 [Alphaproteobacteria bacterium]|nr:hypothetical protein [Alphaproteobacteria bacterium]